MLQLAVLNEDRLKNDIHQRKKCLYEAEDVDFYDYVQFVNEKNEKEFKLYCLESFVQWILIDKKMQKSIQKMYLQYEKNEKNKQLMNKILNDEDLRLISQNFPNKDRKTVESALQIITLAKMTNTSTELIKKLFPFMFGLLPKIAIHEPTIYIEDLAIKARKFISNAQLNPENSYYFLLLFAILYWWGYTNENIPNEIEYLTEKQFGIYHPDDIQIIFQDKKLAESMLAIMFQTFNYYLEHNTGITITKNHQQNIKEMNDHLGDFPKRTPYFKALPKNYQLIQNKSQYLGRPVHPLNKILAVCCDFLSEPTINYSFTPFEENQLIVINEYFERMWQIQEKDDQLQETYTKEEVYHILRDAFIHISPLIVDFNHAKKNYKEDIKHQTENLEDSQLQLKEALKENQQLMNQLIQKEAQFQEKLNHAYRENAQIESLKTKNAILNDEIEQLKQELKIQTQKALALTKEKPSQAVEIDLEPFIQTINQTSTVILGGQRNWQQKMQTKLPNCTYYDPDEQRLIQDLSNTKLMIINTETLNHSIYRTVKNQLPEETIVIYIGNNTNPDVNIQKIYDAYYYQQQ